MRKTFLLLLVICSSLLVALVVRETQMRTTFHQKYMESQMTGKPNSVSAGNSLSELSPSELSLSESSLSELSQPEISLPAPNTLSAGRFFSSLSASAEAIGTEATDVKASNAKATEAPLDFSQLQQPPVADSDSPQSRDASPAALLGDPELLKGIEAYMNGQPDQAYKLFEEAYAANRHLAPGGVLLALLFSNSGKYDSMRYYLEQAIADHPNDPEAFFQLAGIALSAGRLVETELLLDRGIQVLTHLFDQWKTDGLHPETDFRIVWLAGESLSLSAGLEEKRNHLPEAEMQLRKLTELAPLRDDAWLSLGYILMAQNKTTEAATAFNEAHRIDGNNLVAWLIMALILEDHDQRNEAEKMLPNPLDLTSCSEKEVDAVIRLLIKWDRMEEANQLTDSFHKNNMKSAIGWALLGEMELYRHEYGAAETAFRNALLVDSECRPARQGLVWALIDQSNKVKLKEGYKLAYSEWQRDTDDPETAVPYAWTLYLMGRQDESETLFSPILESGHVSPGTAYYLAEIAHAKGNDGLAVNFLDLALGQNTNFHKREAASELRKIIAEQLVLGQEELTKEESTTPAPEAQEPGPKDKQEAEEK